MKLKNPLKFRQMYAEELKSLTIQEISNKSNVSVRTVWKVLRGEPMRPQTARKLATPLGVEATEIAIFTAQ